MNRRDIMLAALSSGGESALFTPVQVQKLFFLIDRELGDRAGGPHFSFQPYDYGPFDRAVYHELETLARLGLVRFDEQRSPKRFALTDEGLARGRQLLRLLDPQVRDYLSRVAAWVRALSFGALVSAIYQKYPDMKVNSIFNQ
jgi:hypothetical protein